VSLKSFHIVFVTLSSLLSFVFGGWSLHVYTARGGIGDLVMTLLAFLLGAGLIVYGFWFWRKITTKDEERRRRRKRIHTAPAVIAICLLSHQVASACSVCYGEADGPMIDAARFGVFLLFGLVLAMQGTFATFFVYLWRRSRRFRRQDGPVDPVHGQGVY
jgi:amino acid transporter